MWILVVSFVAFNAPPPGILVRHGFQNIAECQQAGEAKQEEIRQLYSGRLVAHFDCLRGA